MPLGSIAAPRSRWMAVRVPGTLEVLRGNCYAAELASSAEPAHWRAGQFDCNSGHHCAWKEYRQPRCLCGRPLVLSRESHAIQDDEVDAVLCQASRRMFKSIKFVRVWRRCDEERLVEVRPLVRASVNLGLKRNDDADVFALSDGLYE